LLKNRKAFNNPLKIATNLRIRGKKPRKKLRQSQEESQIKARWKARHEQEVEQGRARAELQKISEFLKGA